MPSVKVRLHEGGRLFIIGVMVEVKEKRRFYRHPMEYPIEITELRWKRRTRNHTLDLSEGGVCFTTVRPITRGTHIQVAIPVHDHLFKLRAKVAYSKKDSKTGLFQTGVSFEDHNDLYRAKLAEELLCIEKYRDTLAQKTGQEISADEAAKDWIAKKAEHFATFFETP